MSASMIRASELDAIKRRAFVGRLVVEDESGERRKRELAKARSTQRAKRWPNTLEAQRANKANARKERLEREEAARVLVDKEEERRRAKERLATIRRANDMLQSQTDRMKTLRAQMILSHTIDARTAQIGEREVRVKAEKVVDARWHAMQERQLEEAAAKEVAAAARLKEKAHTIAEEQKAQLEEYTAEYIKRLTEERLEGELTKQRAAEAVIADREKEEARRRVAKQNNYEMKIANEKLQALRLVEKEKEAAAEAEREAYAKSREAELARREAYVKKKEEDAETRRKVMRDTMERDFMQRMANEGERLDREAEEKRAKDDADLERREARRRKQKMAIDRSRKQQMDRKRRMAEIEADNKIKLTKAWKQVHAEVEAEEREEEEARRIAAKEHEAYLLQQVQERELRAAREKATEAEADKLAVAAQEEDDKLFEITVKKYVAHEAGKGHNAIGVERALRKVQTEGLTPALGL